MHLSNQEQKVYDYIKAHPGCTEEWKPTLYDGYEVSNFGRVRSTDRFAPHKRHGFRRLKGRILKQAMTYDGYKQVTVVIGAFRKSLRVHIAVATAFLPRDDNRPFVNHRDAEKSHNHLDNLEWVTASENTIHYRLMKYGKVIKTRKDSLRLHS